MSCEYNVPLPSLSPIMCFPANPERPFTPHILAHPTHTPPLYPSLLPQPNPPPSSLPVGQVVFVSAPSAVPRQAPGYPSSSPLLSCLLCQATYPHPSLSPVLSFPTILCSSLAPLLLAPGRSPPPELPTPPLHPSPQQFPRTSAPNPPKETSPSTGTHLKVHLPRLLHLFRLLHLVHLARLAHLAHLARLARLARLVLKAYK